VNLAMVPASGLIVLLAELAGVRWQLGLVGTCMVVVLLAVVAAALLCDRGRRAR